jgi:predicted outer membrane repeat protein
MWAAGLGHYLYTMRHTFLFLLALLLLASAFPTSARVRYVKLGATGLNNGTSWANAFNSFDSVCTYVRDTLIPDTFWVANGIYKTHSYSMRNNGLKIYGGFSGTETSLSQRNWSGFQTVLDGDLGSPGVATDNAQGILAISADTGNVNFNAPKYPNMRLDGFKISNSYAGAGVYYEYGSLDTVELSNCLFTQHISSSYGAFSYRCTRGNQARSNSICYLTNCRFENNSSSKHGGAIQVSGNYIYYTHPGNKLFDRLSITDCSFSNNTAHYGGAIANMDSSVTVDITRCIFRGNAATIAGGAFYDTSFSKTNIYNSIIIGNSAPKSGAWHWSAGSTGKVALPRKLIQCTIASNKSTSTSSTDYAIVLNGKDSIENCIIWDNATGSGQQISPASGAAFISTNIIQGVAPGTLSTITLNPLFVSPGSSSGAPFPASASYDYHLAAASPAIDLGLTGITAPAGLNSTDLDKTNRVFGLAPDLGAYEQVYCLLPTVRIKPGTVFICLSSEDSVLLTASGGAGPGSYTWIGRGISGGAAIKDSTLWAKDSGVYHVMSYDSASGCRGQASVRVRVVPKMKPVITRSGSVLSVPPVYSSYQWYKGSALIAGATSNTYTATSNGLYSIWVSIRGAECTDSASYNLTNLGIGGAGAGAEEWLSVYPNPSINGRFNISLDAKQPLKEVSISVTDITGRQVLSRQYANPGKSFFEEINLSGAARGMYFVRIAADGEVISRRVSIQ